MKKAIIGLFALLLCLPLGLQAEESVKEKVGKVLNLGRETISTVINSSNAKATAETLKELGSAVKSEGSDLLYPTDGYCALVQESEPFQAQTWFTDGLGSDIQNALLSNDQFVIDRLPKLYFIIKKGNIDLVDFDFKTKQFTKLRPELFEQLKDFSYDEFDERWDAFWAKKLTRIVGNYRCFEDYYRYDGQALKQSIDTALEIATHLGKTKEVNQMGKILPKQTY